MLKRERKKQKTLAEKVTATILHPNQSGSESDSEDEATAARVIDYDDDEYELPHAGSTEFRKRNVKLLSEQNAKYKGKIVTRKDLESDVSEDEEVDYENSDSSEDDGALGVIQSNQKELSEEGVSEDDETKVSEDAEDEDNDDSEIDTEDEDDDNEIVRKVNHDAELQKGLCVQNQLRIWERLLEFRINSQKLLNKTNQLPSSQELKNLEKSNSEYKDIKETTCKQTCGLLHNLLTLKNRLSSQFPEVEKALSPSLKRPLPFKEHCFEEPPLKQISQYLNECFEQFQPYRNDILLKWDDRTKLLQPGTGSKKKNFSEEYDIIKKIDNALINKQLLIDKSQQIKNLTQNEMTENIRNPNIYDDSDFYHQQLRELIEYKANTTSNMSEVTKQYVELQKLRQKMKKKVDTRASKGRKLRYIVHNKLINFMPPHDSSTWTMESIDELSKSLFV